MPYSRKSSTADHVIINSFNHHGSTSFVSFFSSSSTKQYSEVPGEVFYLCFNTSAGQRNLYFQVRSKSVVECR